MARRQDTGIAVPNPWQLACERFKVKAVKEAKASDNGVKPLDSSERALADLVAKHADVNAATFVNLLRDEGFQIVAPKELQDASYDKAVGAKESMREAHNMEPAWATDEDIWDKAKGVVTKTYGAVNYPVVTYVYKNMGGRINGKSDKPAKKEAASGSAFPQLLKGRTKESAIHDHYTGRLRFMESDAGTKDASRFRCILIQEGLGNFGDAYYYTREALVSAVAVFEGKKIYADHPARDEEQTRPERSVKDVLGHFENVRLEEGKDGRSMLTADVVILSGESYGWARELMSHAVDYSTKYPDKDFVGLSINAKGDATQVPLEEWVKEASIPASSLEKLRQAQENGVDQIRLVTAIREAISCDMVTEAGAGGRIIKLIEGAKHV